MKKTFRFLSMAALLVVGAIMTGCSSDDNIDNPQQPANKDNVVTQTVTVCLDGGAGTRAVNGSTGAKTFEAGNQIAVIYKDGNDKTKKAVSTDFTPTGDNTKATFTVMLSNPANNSAIRYIYPASMAKDVAEDATITNDAATIDYTGLLNSQDGDLTTLGTNYDLAIKDGNLSGTDLPASVTLTNPLAICKFTLTDGTNPITSSVNSLTISDGTNTYAVTPSALSTIYVAMKPATGKIAFTAATGSKTYFKTTASAQTLTASTLYTKITVSMVELARGSVICSDGSVYASKGDATGASKTPVAMIAYLGSDNGEAAPYNHGLALAMSNANGGDDCAWKTSRTDAGHTRMHNYTFTEESGLQYNAMHNSEIDNYPAFKAAIANNGTAAPTGCSAWFLASGYQWTKMFAGDAGTLAGLESGSYWSSSEGGVENAWLFLFLSGYVWGFEYKDTGYHVRSCLAF